MHGYDLGHMQGYRNTKVKQLYLRVGGAVFTIFHFETVVKY